MYSDQLHDKHCGIFLYNLQSANDCAINVVVKQMGTSMGRRQF